MGQRLRQGAISGNFGKRVRLYRRAVHLVTAKSYFPVIHQAVSPWFRRSYTPAGCFHQFSRRRRVRGDPGSAAISRNSADSAWEEAGERLTQDGVRLRHREDDDRFWMNIKLPSMLWLRRLNLAEQYRLILLRFEWFGTVSDGVGWRSIYEIWWFNIFPLFCVKSLSECRDFVVFEVVQDCLN